ncbi:MAG: DotD/TraH family lipoprotein [gamma proteobacterium symbiont of Bathyaustriella thionipta]|nr:DotD/TraH family lipoprotein [gamma proteobacterium symbiont of Bathyaustriella thionipta]MCU7954646.1 DotD/TraH family lipoprotein [gamma proteobacterium symbiont of Bathyaustriella thionipta]MCU7957440.1 DotD/TraH family lipoprotein [gamma proteobacterium symbiont of Bathyaustriella thionipta]MCU7966096.1 DotD/TraH family lipoprotein [gamma proteobacterium symbiont of Bathyaustriella thionipta]
MFFLRMGSVLFVAMVVLSSGCTITPDVREELKINNEDPSLAKLAASADNIQKYWNDIAAMDSAIYQKNNKVRPGFNSNHMPGLEKLISLGDSWSGPVEPLVKEVATLTEYKFRTLGVKPAADVLVTVDTSYRRAVDILADAGYQSGKRAVIRVLAKDRVIEVEYVRY